jgi:hypothetical protein
VHQTDICAGLRDYARQLGIAAQRGHVVHELRSGLERAAGNRRLGRVDRQRNPGEALEHREDPAELLVHVDRRRTGPRRLPAHVHERSPLGGEPEAVGDRVRG